MKTAYKKRCSGYEVGILSTLTKLLGVALVILKVALTLAQLDGITKGWDSFFPSGE